MARQANGLLDIPIPLICSMHVKFVILIRSVSPMDTLLTVVDSDDDDDDDDEFTVGNRRF